MGKLIDQFIQGLNNEKVSNEFYLGSSNPFSTEMVAAVGSLRNYISEIYHSLPGKVREISVEPKVMNEINSKIQNIASIIERYCNVEKVYIGLIKDPLNAASWGVYPWDESMVIEVDEVTRYITKFKSKEEVIKSLREKYDNVLLDKKNGIRFKDKKNKNFIIYISTSLLIHNLIEDFEFTDEEVTGIIFHEIGHCFDHITIGIVQSVMVDFLQRQYSAINDMTGSFGSAYDMMMKQLMDFVKMTKNFDHKDVNFWVSHILRSQFFDSTYQNDGTITYTLKKEKDLITRSGLGNVVQNQLTTQAINTIMFQMFPLKEEAMIKAQKKLKSVNNLFTCVIKWILSPLVIFMIPVILIQNKLLKSKKDEDLLWLEHNIKMGETFSDIFASLHGFSNSISKLNVVYERFINKLTDAPSIRRNEDTPFQLISDFITFRERILSSSSSSYYNDQMRIASTYKYLKNELKSNKSLSNDMKREIENELDKLQDMYKECQILRNKKSGIGRIVSKWLNSTEAYNTIEEEALKYSIVDDIIQRIDEIEVKGGTTDTDYETDGERLDKKVLLEVEKDPTKATKFKITDVTKFRNKKNIEIALKINSK